MKRLLVVVLALTVVAVAGCVALTPQQKRDVEAMQQEWTLLKADLDTLTKSLVEVETKAEAVVADIREKRIPMESGLALLQTYAEEKDAIIGAIQATKARAETLIGKIGELKASGVPNWYVIATNVIAVLGLIGTVVGGERAVAIGKLFKVASTALDMFNKPADERPASSGAAVTAALTASSVSEDQMRAAHHKVLASG